MKKILAEYLYFFKFEPQVLLGYSPLPVTVYIRIILSAIYNPIIIIIQLLVGRGSTQGTADPPSAKGSLDLASIYLFYAYLGYSAEVDLRRLPQIEVGAYAQVHY